MVVGGIYDWIIHGTRSARKGRSGILSALRIERCGAGVATYPPSDSEPRSGGYRGAPRRRGRKVCCCKVRDDEGVVATSASR